MRKRTEGLLILILLMICHASFAENGITAGKKVAFGKYKQHMASNGVPAAPEPIIWRVLGVEGDRVLLLAEQPLAGMPFNRDERFLYDVTWEKSSVRSWLNGDFLNEAFSSGEQQAILQTAISTPDNDWFGFTVSGGNRTTDKVFLLSVEEAEKYLKTDDSRKCILTPYAVFTGAYNRWGNYSGDSTANIEYADDVCMWWLRSPGQIGHYTAFCSWEGSISRGGRYSGDSTLAVRPAIWVRDDILTGKGI